MRGLAILLAGLAWVPPAFADGVSQRPDAATVTVYHDGVVSTAELMKPRWWGDIRRQGLAFITETRTIDLPAGPARIEFRGVASTMVPQTADIQGLPAELVERNFDYDLLSPGSLLARSVGNTVRLVRTDPKTGKTTERAAIVRSAPDGTVLEIDGKFEALGCSGLPEKLVFDRIPEGLRDTPTLSIFTRAPQAGRYTVKLSYIATGLNWSADYVAHIRPDGRTLDLGGWITLANFGDTSFEHVPAEVVAGHLNATGEDTPVAASAPAASSSCWPTDIDWATMRRVLAAMPPPPAPAMMARDAGMLETVSVSGARANIEAKKLGDYKIYALPGPTDVMARQTKQVQFLDTEAVPFERVYTFDVEPSDREVPATAVLRLANTAAGKLGKPLPAGSIAVFEATADGSPVLAGQDNIRDTSVGLPVEIKVGRAMDVRVRCAETERGGRTREGRNVTTLEISIANDKPVPIAFEVHQPVRERLRIVSESRRHAVKPAGFVWTFAMAPGERKVLRYTIEQD